MKKTKKAIVLIYVLFLVTLIITFASIVLNNSISLFNIDDSFIKEQQLYNNIKNDAKKYLESNKKYNSNWLGFNDNISCPSSIVLSGSLNRDVIFSNLSYSESDSISNIFCDATFNSNSLKLYFNDTFSDINKFTYNWNTVQVYVWIWAHNLWDSDLTTLDISADTMYKLWEWIDDNFNSDNYMVTAFWETSSLVYYPDNYQDDDIYVRKTIFWNFSKDSGYKKVFWNTTKTSEIIEENSNNNDNLNLKIWNITSADLFIEIDWEADIQVYVFDKWEFDDFNLLAINNYNETTSISWSWYLQINYNTLSLNQSKTGNEYKFDFQNNDYAIFLKSSNDEDISYKITAFFLEKQLYINPIDDSDNDIVKYLWNDLLITTDNNILSKQEIILFEK